MLRTFVAARDRRPERSVNWGHARATPERSIFSTLPFRTRHFLILAEHRATSSIEEGRSRSRVFTEIKATLALFQHTTVPMRKKQERTAWTCCMG